MRYRLYIFDFDGTLADTFPWFLANLNLLAAKHKFLPFRPEELDELRGLEIRKLMQRLEVPMWKLPLIAKDMRRRMVGELKNFKLHPGVPEALLELNKRGALTAMVSSNSEANVKKVFGPELSRSFSQYQCGASLFGKTRLIKRVLKAASVSARDAVYIGDESRDHEAAAAAGVDFGFVGWGYSLNGEFSGKKPAHIYQAPKDFLI